MKTIATSIALLGFALTTLSGKAQDRERYLIIHADDAGMSHSVNLATQQGLESGGVSSASIMVPCPWFKEFARYAKEHPQYDYGIHLTLNSEWNEYRWGPVSSKDSVPSLIDPEGYLWSDVEQVARHAKAEEVRIELRAQVRRAIDFGVPLSHLDTHMGAVVSRPDLVRVYVELGLEFDLPVLFFKRMTDEEKAAYAALAAEQQQSAAKLTERRLPLLDALLQFYGGDIPEQRERQYKDAIEGLQPGVTQLIIHCGIDNEELRGITSSHARRDQDRRLFSAPETKRWIEDQGIKIISWKQFREMATTK